MGRLVLRLAVVLLAQQWVAFRPGIPAAGAADPDPGMRFAATLPRSAEDIPRTNVAHVAAAADQVADWAGELVWQQSPDDAAATYSCLTRLVAAKQQVDGCLERIFGLRTQLATGAGEEAQRQRLRTYLAITTRCIELAGRLRYVLYDAIDRAAYASGSQPEQLVQLLDLLARGRVSVGANVMIDALFDPPPEARLATYPQATKLKVLDLVADAGTAEVLPDLADFVRQTADELLLVRAIEAMRQIGLPQQPPPQPGPDAPPPPITAEELRSRLAAAPAGDKPAGLAQRRADLLAWLEERVRQGASGEVFRVDGCDVRPGDWLLMRNPSPYNRFTELSPGLFTHVGVVAAERAADGLRRFVVVELPERGDRIPATNIDAYLQRTLHYVFLRHADAAVGRTMGRVAASLIGNEAQFDLNFRTDRISPLRGQLDQRPVIHTYCAGFLLVCAQETGLPREDFFPFAERVAGGHCAANLERLGLSIGDQFVSPTGAWFAPRLELVGRREPMYSPDRQIKESIYDHFARCMIERRLEPSPDVTQSLRQALARFAKDRAWANQALARLYGVSARMDLEAAAKAAALVETLDEIADRNMNDFLFAWQAVAAPPSEDLAGLSPAARDRIRALRAEHAELLRDWSSGRLTPRQLRSALLDTYVRRGREELQERFFRDPH